MTKKQAKRTMSIRVLGLIVLIAIGFDAYFTMIINTSNLTSHHLLLITTVVVFNLTYFIVTIPVFVFKETHKEKSLESMDHLLGKLEYLTPINKETLDYVQNESYYNTNDTNKDTVSAFQMSEGETIQIFKPNQVVTTKKTYNELINMDQYASLLHHYLMDFGLKVELSNIRTMFGAMAATRLIIIKTSHQEISKRFISLFSDFLGANLQELLIKQNYQNFKHFFSENDTIKSYLLDAVKDKDKINILSLIDVDLNGLETYADVFVDYAMNTTLNKTILEPLLAPINELSNNLWFMLVSNNTNHSVNNKINDTAFTVELNASIIMPKEVVHENGLKLSLSAFLEYLRASYDLCYLDEPYWKKIEQMEDYIKTYSPFKIDNRISLQLERFNALYILSGGDSKDCLDTILSAKLLIMIGAFNMTKKENDETSFLVLLEKLFGLENLSQSKAQIKAIEHAFTLEREGV